MLISLHISSCSRYIRAGESVVGYVCASSNKFSVYVERITLSLKGVAQVHYTRHSASRSGEKTITPCFPRRTFWKTSVPATEPQWSLSFCDAGSSAANIEVGLGTVKLPFRLNTPEELPCSFETTSGEHIRYLATVKAFYRSKRKLKTIITEPKLIFVMVSPLNALGTSKLPPRPLPSSCPKCAVEFIKPTPEQNIVVVIGGSPAPIQFRLHNRSKSKVFTCFELRRQQELCNYTAACELE